MTAISGTSGNDNLGGTGGKDTFRVQQGGNDTLSGGDGSDTFFFGAAFDGNDAVDGGAGNKDTIILSGDYSAGITLGANTLTAIENLELQAGYSYKLVMNAASVASGSTFSMSAGALTATQSLNLDASAAVAGASYAVTAGFGNDVITTGAGNDVFKLAAGGADAVNGGAGNDKFQFGASFGSGDSVNGGDGSDTVYLDGDYSAGLTLAANALTAVENIRLSGGHSYDITTDDANVPSHARLAVNGMALGAGDSLTFDGTAETDGAFTLTGGAGDDVLTGGAGKDKFDLSHGGNDIASGGAGNDTFILGGALTAADQIDGGSGVNTVTLDGNYGGGLVLGADTLTNIQAITLGAGHNYALTLDNHTIAAGGTLTVDGSALSGGNSMTVDGVQPGTGGAAVLIGGAGDDVLDSESAAGSAHVTFDISKGGDDTANAGAGNDTFLAGDAFDQNDQFDGGGGINTLYLDGDYSAAIVLSRFDADHFTYIRLGAGHSYDIQTANGKSAMDAVTGGIHIDGSALGAGDSMTVTNVENVTLIGGAGDDTFTGNQNTHAYEGNGGADTFLSSDGGIGSTFIFNSVTDSTSTGFDTIENFSNPTISQAWTLQFNDIANNPVNGDAINAIDPQITTGLLDATGFDADLALAVNATTLNQGDAVLFTPDSGSFAVETFLIVDANGQAGYQAGQDFVIRMINDYDLNDNLTVDSFVGHS